MATALEKVTTHTIKTRVADGEPQSEVALTIHWDDDAAVREFARRGVVIAAQSVMRATGDIPAEFSVTVSELAKRERGGFAMKPTPQNAQRMMAKLDDAQYADALRGIGVNERDIPRLVTNRKAVTVASGAGKSGPVTVTKAAPKK